MNYKEFLDRIGRIRVWKRGGTRAPHKPLLLLLALGRVYRGEDRLASYGGEIEGELRHLLERFGPPRRTHHPNQPFTRLPGDGLWEIPGLDRIARTGGGQPRIPALRRSWGGFPKPVQDLLASDPGLVVQTAQALLDAHFPRSLHAHIRDAVGVPEFVGEPGSAHPWADLQIVHDKPGVYPKLLRDPEFRYQVLRAYERRCAVCDFDVRVGDQLLGLEAAHIKWQVAGGPDVVPNGLALCPLHHNAFNFGALGLRWAEDRVRVLVSSDVNGMSAGVWQLRDYAGSPLRDPQDRRLAPGPEFVAWHHKEVFRGPALEVDG